MSIAQAQRIKELEALVAELCLRVAELERQAAEKPRVGRPPKKEAE